MNPNPEFYLSLFTLVLGVGGGLYLFIDWLAHKMQHRFLLYWSIGLLLQYLFQVPIVLSNLGKRFVLTDFYPFFSLTLSLSFLGLLLVYLGILYAIGRTRKTHLRLVVWFTAVSALYSFIFYDHAVFTSNIPIITTAFLFYVPLYALIFHVLWKWYRQKDWIKTKPAIIGIIMLAIAVVMGMIKSLVFVWGILIYPPSFWFVPVSSMPPLFTLQSLEIIPFVIGFILVHKNCITFGSLFTWASPSKYF